MIEHGTDHSEELRQRPMSELFKQLSHETSTLVRQELELARAEMTEKGKRAGAGAGIIGGAGILSFLSIAALTVCGIAALETAMPLWLAALIVAFVYGAIAGGLALMGKQRIKAASPPVPELTQQTVKEDVAWAKTRARSVRT